ncbi:hypothetical protein [Paenibacillus sp. NPDC058174]|uniref:hypothetical protein n=1 Tax=Paenibacillus sp. NPDC058174 TaxID=3346366 RepID=UPI0036DAB27F
MKKKFLIVVLTLVLSLTGASSAFAYDGWADSKQTAYQFQFPVLGVSIVLNSATDVDWYSYTNNTGSPHGLSAKLQSPPGLIYDFAMIVGGSTSYFSSDTPGGWVKVTIAGNIAPGETVYFQVRGHTYSQFSTTAPYNFTITT